MRASLNWHCDTNNIAVFRDILEFDANFTSIPLFYYLQRNKDYLWYSMDVQDETESSFLSADHTHTHIGLYGMNKISHTVRTCQLEAQ